MNVNEIIAAARDGLLLEPEAKSLLSALGITTTACYPAAEADDAVRIAEQIGYPVVLKAKSPLLLHKSDNGGVELDLRSPGAVTQAFGRIKAASSAIDASAGVTVQKMAAKGIEVIVGVTTDAHFGKVMMFGLGGVLTELYNDVSFRLLPIGEPDAREMMASLKAYRFLAGFRGGPPADIAALVDIMLKVSRAIVEYPAIAELELNPIIVYPRGATVVDARGRLDVRPFN
ncbi:MAG: acetate--CoA ligase family protein [Chloroflexi bacterium]|nr:acetate--CoA ligase family protein [Chloroflexota bacterium]